MGATAVISSAASSSAVSAAGVSATVTSLLSPVGAGIGGITVAVALVFVLAYFDCSSHPDVSDRARNTLFAATLPLLITFAGIVAFRTLEIL